MPSYMCIIVKLILYYRDRLEMDDLFALHAVVSFVNNRAYA